MCEKFGPTLLKISKYSILQNGGGDLLEHEVAEENRFTIVICFKTHVIWPLFL